MYVAIFRDSLQPLSVRNAVLMRQAKLRFLQINQQVQ